MLSEFVIQNVWALQLPTIFIHFNKTRWKTPTQTRNLMLILYSKLFIIAEMYTYTISFRALYSLISWQASISFFSHLSWRSNQSNQPNMTLDSTKNSRARLVHWVITITKTSQYFTVSTVPGSYVSRVLCLTFVRDVIVGFKLFSYVLSSLKLYCLGYVKWAYVKRAHLWCSQVSYLTVSSVYDALIPYLL